MRIIKMANGRTVGKSVGGRAVFNVGPRNYFRKAKGYSLDAGAVSDAAKDCRTITLVEESGVSWSISIADFLANATKINFGWGLKLAAPHSLYQRGGGGAEQLALVAVPPVKPQGPSLGYHGMVGA